MNSVRPLSHNIPKYSIKNMFISRYWITVVSPADALYPMIPIARNPTSQIMQNNWFMLRNNIAVITLCFVPQSHIKMIDAKNNTNDNIIKTR
jgi:hypothetical protein